jgi:hypothetical protein
VCEWVENNFGKHISVPAMCSTLLRHGISRKLLEREARERNELFRQAFRIRVGLYDYRNMIFIDEMGKNDRDIERRYGRAPLNERARSPTSFVRGIKYTVIAAMNFQGIVGYYIIRGAANRSSFLHFLQHTIAGRITPDSVLVYDNARIHVGQEVEQFVTQQLGATILRLPPYSPGIGIMNKLSDACL